MMKAPIYVDDTGSITMVEIRFESTASSRPESRISG